MKNTSKLSKFKGKKKAFFGVILVSFFVFFFFFARFSNLYSNINTQSETWTTPVPKEKKIFNILLMGYGGPGHDGAYLTDTMMFISADTEQKLVNVVSIPRDVWVQIPTKSEDEFARKINSAYQTGLFKENYPDVVDKYSGEQGAGELVKKVVADITGQEVDFYIATDFSGFKKAVDTLGGVEIYVERPFTDYQYPIDGMEDDLCGIDSADLEAFEEKEKIATESPELAYPCRYEPLQFTAGKQTMDGETALKFVRSRHSPQDGGDFNRAKRQQLFLDAVKDRVLSIGFLPKILPLMDDLEQNVKTDLPIELMDRFLKEATSLGDYKVNTIILTTDNYLKHAISADGQYILIPQGGEGKWRTFQKDLKLYLNGTTPTLSPAPSLRPNASQY